MSGRMLAGRFRRQPQYAAPIDWGHPLAKGLIAAPCEMPLRDAARGRGYEAVGAAAPSAPSPIVLVTSPIGRLFGGFNGTAVVTIPKSLLSADDPGGFTVAFDVFIGPDTGNVKRYIGQGTYADGWELSEYYDGHDLRIRNPGDSTQIAAGGTLPVGTFNRVVFVYRNAGATYAWVDCWVNGVQTANNSITYRPGSPGGDLTIGPAAPGFAIGNVSVWNRILSAAEVAMTSADRWLHFRYPGRVSVDMATGGAGAVLDAAGTNVATGTGALSAQIPVAAAGLVVATGSAALTAAIRLALAGASVATGTADLSTTPAGLAAAGGNVATGSAAIVTAIPLGAAAVSVASGAGTITTAITLTAAGVVAALGSALLGTNIRLNAAGQIVSTGTAGLSTNVLMGAVGAALATGTAQITVQIQLNGAGFAVATGTASLTAPGSGLAASGAAIATATANLSSAIPLIASGAALGTGSGALQTAIRVAAAGADVVTGTASLTLPIALAAAGVSAGNGNGTLSTSITLSAQGWAQVIGAGGITTVIRLAAAGVSQAVGSGLLSGFLYVPTPRSHSLRMGAVARSMRLPPQRRSCRLPPINRTLSRITMGAT